MVVTVDKGQMTELLMTTQMSRGKEWACRLGGLKPW